MKHRPTSRYPLIPTFPHKFEWTSQRPQRLLCSRVTPEDRSLSANNTRRCWLVNNCTTVIGLDVHKKTVVAAILPSGADRVRTVVQFENERAALERLVRQVTGAGPVEFVYEAGPCGYEIQRQLAELGQACAVVAPALIPVRPGDRVKTDRRDAEKLARLYRAGELTTIRVPTREEEAARDLVRTREDALVDRLRARQRLAMFLLRQGRMWREKCGWTAAHWQWVREQKFDWESSRRTFEAYVRALEEAQARLEGLNLELNDLAQRAPFATTVRHLRSLKGVDTLTALTLAVETPEMTRFECAPRYMGLTGLVSSEHSSGGKVRRGRITRMGNAHARRVLVEAAWSYQRRSVGSKPLAKRREGCAPEIVLIARKAEERLHKKFTRLVSRGKPNPVAAVAVARELAGFVWSIASHPMTVAAE